MKNLYFCIVTLLSTTCNIAAQTSCSQFIRSTQPYQSLQNGINLTNEWDPWNGNHHFRLSIGFTFQCCGVPFDTVDIQATSSLYFGSLQQGNNYCFKGFSGAIADLFWVTPGANESLSPVSFENTGPPGNRVLKVQWSNAGFLTGLPEDFIHFQIWLYEETNAIEVHFGPQHVTSSSVYEGSDHTGPVIGFLNEQETEYVYLYGASQNPAFGYPPFGFKGLDDTPEAGTVFTFSPAGTPTTTAYGRFLKINHNHADRQIVLENAENVQQMSLTECSGKVLEHFYFDQHNPTIQIRYRQYPAGLFFLMIGFQDQPLLIQKILFTGK